MPAIWIVAGPNGAGKSSFIQRANFTNIPIVNPDILLADNPKLGEIGAGRKALSQQNDMLSKGRSFVYETTFSQARPEALFSRARQHGHRVNLIYVGIQSPDDSIGRIASRVAEGGHHVAAKDVFRRFDRSMLNFQRLAGQADRLLVLDNSGRDRRLVLSMREQRLQFVSRKLPDWYQRFEPGMAQKLRLANKRQAGISL